MNRFFVLALIAALCGSGALHAQDIITLRSGEEIKAIVVSVTASEVVFKPYNDPQGLPNTLQKAQVSMITYRDGSKDVFNPQYVNQQQYGNRQQSTVTTSPSSGDGNPQQYTSQQQYANPQQYGNQQQNINRQQYGNQQQYRKLPSSGWSVFHIGISFPGDDLGDDTAGGMYAGTGFGVGLKSYRPLVSVLSLVYGAELYYHGLSSDRKEDVEDSLKDYDFTHPMYFNLPVTIGGNFTAPLPDAGISLYGELAAGLNVSYLTKEGREYSGTNGNFKYKRETSYKPASDFCYGFEAGIAFNDRFHIGFRYNNWGTYRYKYKTTTEQTTATSTLGDPVTTKNSTNGKTIKYDLTNTVLVLGVRF